MEEIDPEILRLAQQLGRAPKAKDIIAAVVKNRLAAEMKSRGFSKKGLEFARRRGETAHVVKFELSSWNMGDRGSFTVTVGVMFDDMIRQGGREPTRLPKLYDLQFGAELAELAAGAPRSWQVDRYTNVAEMSQALCGFILEVVSRLDDVQTTGDFERTGWVSIPPWGFPPLYAYVMGRLDEAERLVRIQAEFFADRGATYEGLLDRYDFTLLKERADGDR